MGELNRDKIDKGVTVDSKLFRARTTVRDGEHEYGEDVLVIAPSLEDAEKQMHDHLSTYWGDDTEKMVDGHTGRIWYEGDGGAVIVDLEYVTEITCLTDIIGGAVPVMGGDNEDAVSIAIAIEARLVGARLRAVKV